MFAFTSSRAVIGAALGAALFASAARAQHEGHDMSGHGAISGPLGISMDRMGSGTTWIPDAVTLPSRHLLTDNWMLMLHGFAFLQYNEQSGPRGDRQFGSLNWAMLMASRMVGNGHLQLRTMLSLDPWSVTARGYPLLAQVGETYLDAPLRDRQHPHDFWMEVGALYERPIRRDLGFSLYAAPSGEPALGPVAFMHRPSAMDDPIAPLGHHWHDATHITYGVLTTGLFTRRWKLEGSYFNGREPDEDRFYIDPIRLDSYSGRLTANPSANLSMTLGYGVINGHERLYPDLAMRRVVASIMYGQKLGTDGQTATTFVWGSNDHHDAWSHSALLESEAILDRKHTIFGRLELTQRTDVELAIESGSHDAHAAPGAEQTHATYNIGSASLGYIFELGRSFGATTGLGGRLTLNVVPGALKSAYGSAPTGFLIFLRVRPYHR
jgi:hypothetical protein